MKRPSIAIVGAGRLGTTLARRLTDASYSIAEIIVRTNSRSLPAAGKLSRRVGARVVTKLATRLDADLIWFCVPDSEVTKTAALLAKRNWRGKIAFHSSGVLTSDALDSLKKIGAAVASVHPLMTFVAGSTPDLRGVSFAIEGDIPATRAARKIVRDLGGEAVPIKKKDKAAYHAFATMICPLLVSLLAASEAAAASAGISSGKARRRMMPIIRQTLVNYLRLGPAAAFSGPIVRGDAATIRQHLRTLAKTPPAKDAYLGVARAALEYLPSRNQKELQKLLRRPNST
jgi:predicted short-subunit dehydrogenase-like oxidoreductase (DUF2520 family)